jgi:NADP-dependent 3-hydroxy acid dehydrogenase YdfG
VSAALQGKVAVVTGGSSGIGLATARELSRLGASVTVAARSADRLASALDTLRDADRTCRPERDAAPRCRRRDRDRVRVRRPGDPPGAWYSASQHALRAFVHGVRRQLVGTGVRLGLIAPGVVLNDLWKVTAEDDISERIAVQTGIRSEDMAEAVTFMLTRPRHVTIRDLVVLPTNQEI